MTKTTLTAALILAVAACGGGNETGGADTTAAEAPGGQVTTAPAAETTTAPPAGETTTTAGVDGIQVAETELGSILVDPEGFSLYIFTNDSGGESTCYDSCAATWPPVPADTPLASELDASLFGSTTRTDGTEQLTVNGMPLYTYAPDTEPGQINGQGVGGVWFVVAADGNPIGPEASEQDVADPGDDYDY